MYNTIDYYDFKTLMYLSRKEKGRGGENGDRRDVFPFFTMEIGERPACLQFSETSFSPCSGLAQWTAEIPEPIAAARAERLGQMRC